MNDITRGTWNRKLKSKKKNTAPGENGVWVDHIVAATTEVQDALREMCNIVLCAKSAFMSWYVELVNKVPKDEGVVKIKEHTTRETHD